MVEITQLKEFAMNETEKMKLFNNLVKLTNTAINGLENRKVMGLIFMCLLVILSFSGLATIVAFFFEFIVGVTTDLADYIFACLEVTSVAICVLGVAFAINHYWFQRVWATTFCIFKMLNDRCLQMTFFLMTNAEPNKLTGYQLQEDLLDLLEEKSESLAKVWTIDWFKEQGLTPEWARSAPNDAPKLESKQPGLELVVAGVAHLLQDINLPSAR